MNRRVAGCTRSTGWLATLLLVGLPTHARAQAWVPPAGSGSVTVLYQYVDNTGHRLTNGSLLDDGKSVDESIYAEVQYALTDRLSMALGVPYIFSKFIGPSPPPARLPGDLCHCWHDGLQDVGFTARYNLIAGIFALTPSIAYNTPSHAYAYKGEAVIGTRLHELRLGLDAGRRLDAVSPNLYVTGQYTYAFVQHAAGVSHDRSSLSGSVGYLVTHRLLLNGLAAVQRTHGGLRFGSLPPADLVFPGEVNTPERFEEHDRLLRDNNWRLGGGAVYSLSHTDLFVTLVAYMGGTDTHAGRAWTFGTTWRFERTPHQVGPPPQD